MTAPRRGARRQVNVKDLTAKDLAPLRGATQLTSHSRWSPRTPTTGYFLCNPSGCWGESTIWLPWNAFLVSHWQWTTGLKPGLSEKRAFRLL